MSPRTEAIQRYVILRDKWSDDALEVLDHIASHIAQCPACCDEWYCLRAWRLNSEFNMFAARILRTRNLIEAV